jgi:hypothetical protein
VVTSYRGTDLKDSDDLHTDALLAVGLENFTSRFKRAEKSYQSILNDYPKHNHVLASHSLGAAINLRVAEAYPRVQEVHNYNPGSSVQAVRKNIKATLAGSDKSHIHSYFIEGDLISTMGRGDPSHQFHVLPMLAGSANPHSLDQFLK